MCTGVAIALDELPVTVAEDPRLANRVYDRFGRKEMQFHWWQSPTILPVLWEGQLHLFQWGNKVRRSPLPFGPWICRERIDDGSFAASGIEPVVVPANLGHHKGTWFLISEGIRGVLFRDRAGGPVVYLLTEPATNYYRNMTEQEPTMPVLVGQVI